MAADVRQDILNKECPKPCARFRAFCCVKSHGYAAAFIGFCTCCAGEMLDCLAV